MSKLKQQIKAERAKYTDDPLPTYQHSSVSRPSNEKHYPTERRELTLSGILEGSHTMLDEKRRNQLSPEYPQSERTLSDHSQRALSQNMRSAGDDRASMESRSTESKQSRNSSLPPPHQSYFQPPSNHSSLQRVQYRMRTAVSSEMDERRRRNQAGKLGPRLAGAEQIVSHNNAMASASRNECEPQIEDDDSNEISSTNESEANGSFRSAATVGSIPPQVSSKAKKDHSQLAKTIVSDLGVEGHQAIAAMSVIDRVTNITEDQLRKLDAETRAQVLFVVYFYHFPDI